MPSRAYSVSGLAGTANRTLSALTQTIVVKSSEVAQSNACADTTLNLTKIKGAKKLIYTHVDLPLTAVEDFGKAAEENAGTALGTLYADLDALCKAAGNLWCAAAEKRLLEYANVEA